MLSETENQILSSVINHSNNQVAGTSWLMRETLDRYILERNGEVRGTTEHLGYAKQAALFVSADIIDRHDIRSYRSRCDQLVSDLRHGTAVAA